MRTTIHIHPDGFKVVRYTAPHVFACIEMNEGQHQAAIFLNTPELCDELIKAAVAAKAMPLGETSEPLTAEDNAGRAIVADLSERAWDGRGIGAEDMQADPGGCEASRIGFGRCVNEQPYHPGWHENAHGAGWPQYDEDIDLDVILTSDSYALRPYSADVTR